MPWSAWPHSPSTRASSRSRSRSHRAARRFLSGTGRPHAANWSYLGWACGNEDSRRTLSRLRSCPSASRHSCYTLCHAPLHSRHASTRFASAATFSHRA